MKTRAMRVLKNPLEYENVNSNPGRYNNIDILIDKQML